MRPINSGRETLAETARTFGYPELIILTDKTAKSLGETYAELLLEAIQNVERGK